MELVNEDGYFNYEQEDFDQDQGKESKDTESANSVPPVSVPIISQKAPHWGPVQAERQSTRIQSVAGKTVLEMAKDLKKKKLDLQAPSKFQGIASHNPFDILQKSSLVNMAHKFGVHINNAFESDTSEFKLASNLDIDFKQHLTPENVLIHSVGEISLHNTEGMSVGQSPSVASTVDCLGSNSPVTPLHQNLDDGYDSERDWIKVCKYRRGKHPRKIVFQ
jgi:hypothetical protein